MLAVIGGPPIDSLPLVDLYDPRSTSTDNRSWESACIRTATWPGPTEKQRKSSGRIGPTYTEGPRPSGDGRVPRGSDSKREIDEGSLYLGSPTTVATKIASVVQLLGLSRFDLAYATGRVPHEQKMATIEMYGREVIPR